MTQEETRLADANAGKVPWRQWGPYLSDRQWGTVREDYSEGGTAWDYFPHDHARSRAYRWGEDGLAGICDDQALLCFALALWNGNDPILKERLFGLTNSEGNHGEDVKEYAFPLDNTPTHSYMKLLYKYPHAAYPYADLVAENARRKADPRSFEYELLDTGVFANNAYTDVGVEYAKNTPTDILIRITLTNRGPQPKDLHVLPTLWFRNTWSWQVGNPKPSLRTLASPTPGTEVIEATQQDLGVMSLYCQTPDELLFVDNETNFQRLYGTVTPGAFPKDGINDYVVHGAPTVNPAKTGTKASAHYHVTVGAGQSVVLKLRLISGSPGGSLGADFDAVFVREIQNADEFYNRVSAAGMVPDLKMIQRQAFASLLWNKQFFYYVVDDWLQGDPAFPAPPTSRLTGRNSRWGHFYAEDVISMPDKWEYPWFASWDLCFHTIVWALIDPQFAKDQLVLLAREWYMHPEGQVPAYEWSFNDVNPPVHAWAAWRVYQIEKKMYGTGDVAFLSQIFNRCLLYFTWWVNRKDADGNNLFQGGFLGLDNIGVFDRNSVPDGATIYQTDGSSWMGLFALTMIKIGLELSATVEQFDDMAVKFFQHFVYLADSLNHSHVTGPMADLWDDQDGFYYDSVRLQSGAFQQLRVRSVEGLMPLFAVETVLTTDIERAEGKDFQYRIDSFLKKHPELALSVSTVKNAAGLDQPCPPADSMQDVPPGRVLLSMVSKDKLTQMLKYALDENEFLSPGGIRSVSRYHLDNPVNLNFDGANYSLNYAPAESITQSFGGNSNWRGPVWFPINYILIESLQKYHYYYGDDFKVECPTGSGNMMTLWEVSQELSRRLISIFARGADGTRPVYGGTQPFQQDPNWRDCLMFFEYFHGDNRAGLGASHQTGWTSLVAKLIQQTTTYS
jgi:hypothetical protein